MGISTVRPEEIAKEDECCLRIPVKVETNTLQTTQDLVDCIEHVVSCGQEVTRDKED